MIFCWLSIIISICTLILELILTFIDVEAHIHSFIGDDEIYILIGISIILLISGLIRNIKKDKELYG